MLISRMAHAWRQFWGLKPLLRLTCSRFSWLLAASPVEKDLLVSLLAGHVNSQACFNLCANTLCIFMALLHMHWEVIWWHLKDPITLKGSYHTKLFFPQYCKVKILLVKLRESRHIREWHNFHSYCRLGVICRLHRLVQRITDHILERLEERNVRADIARRYT